MIKTAKNKKLGFSLFEALVSMLILSLFFLASTKVITQKQKIEFQRNPHGFYECYIANGSMWQHRVIGNTASSSARTNRCIFEPPKGVTFVNVHYFDGSRYYNGQQLILNERLELNSPAGIYDPGVFGDGDGEMDLQAIQDSINQFKMYLKISHPNSGIYTTWQNSGTPPVSVMLAW